MKDRESRDMYLKTIYRLRESSRHVRAVDIAAALAYSRPSVSSALKKLSSEGFVQVEEGGDVRLSPPGQRHAAELWERSRLLTELLQHMGASEQLAAENACRLEHVISPECMDIIRRYLTEQPSSSRT